MNILIAPDSFKHSMRAADVCECIKIGISASGIDAEIVTMPMADGGEGTLEALVSATGGKCVPVESYDPLGREIAAEIGLLGDGKTAVVEMAKASGIELLQDYEKNPLLASTYGTGLLIKAALDLNCEKLILALGGSATNDGGAGAMLALGAKFLDEQGVEIVEGGAALHFLNHINLEKFDERIEKTEFIVACDVTNPLTGENGATKVYAHQKGALPEYLDMLDNALGNYGSVLSRTFKKNVADELGAGAAGGFGAGAMAFLNAEMKSGFSIVSETAGLENAVKKADVIITGEGRIDRQTAKGKVPMGVARLAKRYGKKLIAVGGTVSDDADCLYEKGFDVILQIADDSMSIDEAIKNTATLLERAGLKIATEHI